MNFAKNVTGLEVITKEKDFPASVLGSVILIVAEGTVVNAIGSVTVTALIRRRLLSRVHHRQNHWLAGKILLPAPPGQQASDE